MKIAFIVLCIGWLISVGVWFYTILNKKRRENLDYTYPLIAIIAFNAAISILSMFI